MKESGAFDLRSKLAFLNKINFRKKEKNESPEQDQAEISEQDMIAVPEQEIAEVPEQVNAEMPEQKKTVKSKNKVLEVIRILCLAAYRLRAVFLAIPVVIAALRLAAYNSEHLPLLVGLNLQSTGEFAKVISRQTAVSVPLLITGGCLALMCFSRKTLYPWLISVFSLVIPVLLLITNIYPA